MTNTTHKKMFLLLLLNRNNCVFVFANNIMTFMNREISVKCQSVAYSITCRGHCFSTVLRSHFLSARIQA